MSVELKPVTSSAISHLGHDADTSEMHVRFTSGTQYVVKNVSAQEYKALCAADSIGTHFSKHFAGRQIRPMRRRQD